ATAATIESSWDRPTVLSDIFVALASCYPENALAAVDLIEPGDKRVKALIHATDYKIAITNRVARIRKNQVVEGYAEGLMSRVRDFVSADQFGIWWRLAMLFV